MFEIFDLPNRELEDILNRDLDVAADLKHLIASAAKRETASSVRTHYEKDFKFASLHT